MQAIVVFTLTLRRDYRVVAEVQAQAELHLQAESVGAVLPWRRQA